MAEIRSYGPGKFDTVIDSYVYQVSLDGWLDDECGESETTGWYGLLLGTSQEGLLEMVLSHCNQEETQLTDAEREFLKEQGNAIISEDSQGFVSVEYFEDANKAVEQYRETEAEIAGMEEEEN